MKQLTRYFMAFIFIFITMTAGCNGGGGGGGSESGDNVVQTGSSYFPLDVGSNWGYEVSEDGNVHDLLIEIDSISDDGYYLLSVTEDGVEIATYEVKEVDDRVVTRSGKIVAPKAGETVAVADMVFLFTRHYSPDRISDSMTFVSEGELIKGEYVDSPSNTYNSLNLFGIEFQKNVGMYRFTDQKYFDNPYWGPSTDTSRGTLLWTNMDGAFQDAADAADDNNNNDNNNDIDDIDDTNDSESDPGLNISGEWILDLTEISNNCGGVSSTPSSYEVELTQTHEILEIVSISGGADAFVGKTATLSGNTATFSATYPEDGGNTSETVTLIFNSDDTLSGSSDWEWTDSSYICDGSFNIQGYK